MLKRMILINSANFQFADIDLSKEIFFVGDNASGKTTTTRAIHFLYNGHGDKLGIPRTKSSFSKHYFPHDDSYIIYVFESFFIFTYKRNDTIKRWFSKQEFNLDRVIKDTKLVEYKQILNYIKEPPLKVKPDSIQSYTDILYGADKKYLDFSIAKIDNYKIFLEVFNMIFNVDKAIVTAIDIKKAIQKSLDRKDEVLSIDYDDFIRKLNQFSNAYNFFKVFDKNRDNLSNAITIKDILITLEEKEITLLKAINYRSKVEIEEFNQLNQKKLDQKAKEDNYKTKLKNINSLYNSFEKRVKTKINFLEKEILLLEELREKFDSLEVEANIEKASMFDSIKSELDNKKFDLKKLQDDLSSAQTVIENQIKQIEYKIEITIPNQMKKKFYDLRSMEITKYEEDKLFIENDFEKLENTIFKKIEQLEINIQEYKTKIEDIDNKISSDIKLLRAESNKQADSLRTTLNQKNQELYELNSSLRVLKDEKDTNSNKLKKHDDKYIELRKSNSKSLQNTRKNQNQKIANARAILNPISNSFNEFLSQEIEDRESEIYPIIDKKLLLKSIDELKPQKIQTDVVLGFKIDSTTLETIPTKDEAIEIIKKAKLDKSQALKNSKSVYRDAKAKLDEIRNEIVADIESMQMKINTIEDLISKGNLNIKELKTDIDEVELALENGIANIDAKYKNEKDSLIKSKNDFSLQINDIRNIQLRELKKDKQDKINQRKKDSEKNIDILKSHTH